MSFPAEFARLAERVRRLEQARTRFANVSLDSAGLPIYDDQGNLRGVVGLQDDGTYTHADFNAPPPPVPSTPTVYAGMGALVVMWDGGTATDDPWPLDFLHVEVHLAGSPDFEPTDDTQVGTLASLRGGGFTIAGLTPGQTYYACLVAVNRSKKESAPTPTVAGTPESAVDDATLQGIQDDVAAAQDAVAHMNSSYYAADPPDPPEGGFHDGDQWWQLFDDGSFAGWRWDAAASGGVGAWTPYQFGSDALIENSIQAKHIIAEQVQAQHIAAEAVNTEHLGAEAVTAEKMRARTITGDKFAAQVVFAAQMVTGVVDEETGEVVGQHTDIGPRGIENYSPAGDLNALITNDPNETSFLRSRLETEELRVKGGLAVESDRNEFSQNSETTLQEGISDPTAAPVVASVYDKVQFDTDTEVSGDTLGKFSFNPAGVTGFGWNAGLGCWTVAEQRTKGTRLWRFNPDGSLYESGGAPLITDLWGAQQVTGCFAAGTHTEESWLWQEQGSGWWYLRFPDVGTVYFNRIPDSWIVNPNQAPLLGLNNTGGYCLFQNNNQGATDDLQVKNFAFEEANNGTAISLGTLTCQAGTGRAAPLVGATYGTQTGVGATRIAYASANISQVLMLDGAGNKKITEQFPLDGQQMGLAFDGDNYWSLDDSGTATKYENWSWTDSKDLFAAAYAWYDSGRGNGVTHETLVSQLSTITAKKRAKVKITVGPVPDKGGVDDPDTFRLYALRASSTPGTSSLVRIFEGGSSTGATSVYVVGDPTGTGHPKSKPNSAAFPAATPAKLLSGAVDIAGRRKFQADGSGGGRWPRLVQPGTIREWSGGATPPAGWAFPNGQAVSRATYAELAAQYWDGANYAHGNGNGSTTFNLPNVPSRGKYETGLSPFTVATGFNIVQQDCVRMGRVIQVRLVIERTGSTISSVSDGDVPDVTMATVPAEWRPDALWVALTHASGPLASAQIQNDGLVVVTALSPGQGWPTNTVIRWGGTYIAGADSPTANVRTIIYLGDS